MGRQLLSVPFITLVCTHATAIQINLPGDTLSAGSSHVLFENRFSEWQSSGDYLDNTTTLDADERNEYTVRGHGNRWEHLLTYQYGITDRWSLGIQQGYAESRWRHSIDDNANTASEGRFESAGETDSKLFVQQGLAEGVAMTYDLSIPSAGANQAQSNGTQGDEGLGYTQAGIEIGANWLTELNTHWLGRARLDANTRQTVNGEAVSGPWCISVEFGSNLVLKDDQALVLTWHLMNGFPYTSYDKSLGRDVKYGDQNRFGFNSEYQWNLTSWMQVQGYLNLAMTQPAVQKFKMGGVQQRVEEAGGTYTTLGLALKADF